MSVDLGEETFFFRNGAGFVMAKFLLCLQAWGERASAFTMADADSSMTYVLIFCQAERDLLFVSSSCYFQSSMVGRLGSNHAGHCSQASDPTTEKRRRSPVYCSYEAM